MEVLAMSFYGNTVQSWLVALGVALLALIVLCGAQALLAKRLRGPGEEPRLPLATAVVDRTRGLVLLVIAIYAGSLGLALPERLRGILLGALVIVLLVQAGFWVSAALEAWLARERARRAETDPAAVTTLGALGFLGRLAVWAIVLLLVLDNLGVNITGLVAGLGIGGIAIALAVQNILGDLFASLSIVLDKPFAVGDFLMLGDLLGTVEYVGLKTTRLRSLSGEQLVFANSDLLASRIRNYGRMYERRIVFTIGVTYQTPREKLERIPGILREAVEAQGKTRFDRSHFARYGAYSLDFETVYYVTEPDYALYMDIQQAINFHLHARFEAEGIEFAYPTQTLFVARPEAA